MSFMRCVGYYIVKPIDKPDYLKLDVSNILSVGECISDKFPDLTKCFWINYPKEDRIRYKEKLQLNDDEFSEFCGLISDLFNSGLLDPYVRFSRIEDALKVYNYFSNSDDYRIIGLFTDSVAFDEYEKEGAFSVFKTGEETSKPCNLLGCDILGMESGGSDGYYFECYLADSLNEDISEKHKGVYKVNQDTGLIMNPFFEVKTLCKCIQGKGEAVIWVPFELYEYPKNVDRKV